VARPMADSSLIMSRPPCPRVMEHYLTEPDCQAVGSAVQGGRLHNMAFAGLWEGFRWPDGSVATIPDNAARSLPRMVHEDEVRVV
jgi:hypothetical protein